MARWRRKDELRSTPGFRWMLAVFGFAFMGPGLLTLFHGGIEYEDYRAVVVFAPFGVMIGLVMIIVAIRLEVLDRRRRSLRHRVISRA